jgi:hypothetical protein
MTKEINDGGPVFPARFVSWTDREGNTKTEVDLEDNGGLSLRDYFAAHALQMAGAMAISLQISGEILAKNRESFVAQNAYRIADEMLKARQK